MSPLILFFGDGSSFLAAMTVVAIAAIATMYVRGRLARAGLTILLPIAAAVAMLSSTPLTTAVYAAWIVLLLATVIYLNVRPAGPAARGTHLILPALLAASSAALALHEASYRLNPRLDLPPNRPVAVIGDSLSAGIGTGERCWPAVLADRTGRTVNNLAVGGAKVADALAQVPLLPPAPAVVLVAIGGNDVLGTTTAGTFRRDLDRLLTALHEGGYTTAMFELPLPPGRSAFVAAQRDLARRHDVALIPKRHLAAVLGGPDATIDGLHLSQSGHDHLATIVSGLLE